MIHQRLQEIRRQISSAELQFHRQPGAVCLLAVSKKQAIQSIIGAYQAGQRHFGESYVQEALAKQQHLGAFAITWHFIGPIQANKTKLIARHFTWAHSVDNYRIAERLSAHRPDHLPPLNVCLQVNISAEHSKSGVELGALAALYHSVVDLPGLRVRGVMAIPAPETDFVKQREPYRRLRHSVAEQSALKLDCFSFGMSGDLEAAIAEGATMVRVGTALFGQRR